MPPSKRARKATKAQFAAGFFQKSEVRTARDARVARRAQTREEFFKRERDERASAAEKKRSRKAAPVPKAPVSEQIVSVREKLRADKGELEKQILALVADRSAKESIALDELDFSIWELIWQWKLLDNRLQSLDVRTGMLFEHQQLVRDIVVANGMVSWYRPINLEAQGWLSKGGQGKALLTKGKSSRFDCIAGLIPVDVRLSKLMKDPDAYDVHSLAYYQSNMDFVNELYDTDKVSDAAIEQAYPDLVFSGKIKQARAAVAALKVKIDKRIALKELEQYRSYIEIAHALPQQTAVQHTVKLSDGIEYSVYYLVNAAKQKQDKARMADEPHRSDVVFSEDVQPIFVIQKAGEYVAYNTQTHTFDKPYGEVGLPAGLNAKPLQIMAYQQFELDEGRVVRCKPPHIVTADYDEGASVALRVHPFMQNTELAMNSFSILQLVQPQGSQAALQAVVEQYTHETLCRHETDRNVAAKDIVTHGTMGRATEAQRAMLVYLRDATGWTINHGPEANSPAPQKFEPEETYPCFYPDGRVEMLTGSEKTVCEFVNEQRAKGFPLAVNPRWDWKIDAEGRFRVPRDRFDWEPVDHFLKESQLKANAVDQKYQKQGDAAYEIFLSCDLDKLISRVQGEEDLSELEQDYLLVASHNFATEIVDILLQIELLRVQPTLVYPGLIDSYKYRVLSKEDQELYQQRIRRLMAMFHAQPDRVEIADHDDIREIVSFYGGMEAALGELEKTTPGHASRHKHDGSIKERLEGERRNRMHALFEDLENKRNKYDALTARGDVLFSLIRLKHQELIALIEPVPSGVISLSAGGK